MDPNKSIRDIGRPSAIADWALKQDDFGQKWRSLIVLFDRAAATSASDAKVVEEALHEYLRIIAQIESHPPAENVPFESTPTSVKQVVTKIYNSAAFSASEGIGATGAFLRIKPPADSQWLPLWQEQYDQLQQTWRDRMAQLDNQSTKPQ